MAALTPVLLLLSSYAKMVTSGLTGTRLGSIGKGATVAEDQAWELVNGSMVAEDWVSCPFCFCLLLHITSLVCPDISHALRP